MPRNSMPAGWEPPALAWQSAWQDDETPLVTGVFGIQCESPALLDDWAARAFSGACAPFAAERGAYVDHFGVSNHLYVCYWRKPAYDRWWSLEANSGWWRDSGRITERVGYWREIFTMPFDRFETLHSTTEPHGIGVSADRMDGPIMEHGYPGGMRDRIPRSESSDLRSTGGMAAPLDARSSGDGLHVAVTPPENMCVIRSGQNWAHCDAEQRSWYLEKLHPVLLEGMRYLRDNPREANCYSLRFVDRKDDSWSAMEQSFGLGFATDVHAFEQWAKSHPTHLAIFDGFLQMVDTFGGDLQLRLWHEVTALPGEGCEFEYIACHPGTGLLSYAS